MNWKVGLGVVVAAALSACPVKVEDYSCDAGCFGDEYCDVTSHSCISRSDGGHSDGGRTDAGTVDAGHVDGGTVDGGSDGGVEPCTPGQVCREAHGLCDLEETCNSNRECPPDVFKTSAIECHPSVSDCDVAEYCTGDSPDCPVDTVAAANKVCHAPVGVCDAPEYCDGVTTVCPADQYWTSSTVCHPTMGDCDVEERCTGASPDCPADLLAPQGTGCRGAVDVCDRAEVCTGLSPDCPADGFLDAGVVCRSPADLCDAQEVCTGSSVTCPADAVLPNGTSCRDQVSNCDVREVCNGVAMTCPADAFQPSTYPCVPQFCLSGVVTPPRYCAGNTPTCNPGGSNVSCNGYQCNGTNCGTTCASGSDCLSTHFCDTSVSQCSPKRVDGQVCSGSTSGFQCTSGSCIQVYTDGDQDGFGTGTPVFHCGTAATTGFSTNNSDCCDTDGNAKPGQTGYFSTARVGCGGYDYDCVNGEVKQAAIYNVCQTSGSCDTSDCPSIGDVGWSAASVACGATSSWVTNCGGNALGGGCSGGTTCNLRGSMQKAQPCH